jgi:K319-like protein/Big-like domain-containing protein
MTAVPSTYPMIFSFAESDNTSQQEYDEQAGYDNPESDPSDYDYGQYDAPTYGSPVSTSPFDDAGVTDENSDIIINTLSNDRLYYGDQRTPRIDQVYEPMFGSVIVNSDGSIIYSPSQLRLPGNISATDTFFYTASFADDSTSYYSGQVTITINQVNDAPRVIDSEYVITENQDFSFFLKAYDEDNDKLTFFVTSDPTTLGYFVLDNLTGMLTYTPDTDFIGQDFISYVVWDGKTRSDTATVMLDVVKKGENIEYESDDYVTSDSISYDYYYDYVADQGYSDYTADQGYYDNSTYDSVEQTETVDEEYSNPPQEPAYPWSPPPVEQENVTNAKPIADAGRDIGAFQGEEVNLDGFGSHDSDGDTLSYSWKQIFGPTVTLVEPMSADPTFVTPDVVSDTTMIFELVVSDGELSSDRSFVTVTVEAQPEVIIDILPNLYPNYINMNKEDQKVPVAIFGSISLDVSTYFDQTSLRFGPHSAEVASEEQKDINNDAFDDLVLYFKIGDLGLQSGNTESCLSGSLQINYNPIPFESCDSVRVLK